MNKINPIQDIVKAQHIGLKQGIFSICSANPHVIAALFDYGFDSENYVLIESTSNQVNQFGGYSGMNAAQFANFVHGLAAKVGFPTDRILLGGDHLGPNPWQDEPAQSAMDKSRVLVSDSIKAGYSKIHLDASMKCADDVYDKPLDVAVSAKRAAQMCQAAEQAYLENPVSAWKPCYIIGTEVPIPGGTLSGETELSVTTIEDAQQTINVTKEAFYELGLENAWERVVGLVVQPGVEFGDSSLIHYDRKKSVKLSKFIEAHENMVFEAHSTDYQTPDSLKQMVEDHFAILKVGPALTFAFREAVFSLELMEKEWLQGRKGVILSNLQEVLEKIMLENSKNWKKYYQGDEVYLRFARKFSYSDRSRYYWSNNEIQESLDLLLSNLSKYPVPESLLSQFMPHQYRKVMKNELNNEPFALIYDRIKCQIDDYVYAC